MAFYFRFHAPLGSKEVYNVFRILFVLVLSCDTILVSKRRADVKLEGKLFRANLLIADAVAERAEETGSFVKDLEACLLQLCRDLEVPIPIWMEKNTHEFARFRQTIFFEEQFTDKVQFNRFQIKLLKS